MSFLKLILLKLKIQNIDIAVTKIRTSTQKLPIETGRYKEIERPERKCNFCGNNEIGDEFHYFMKCSNPHFIILREEFMKDILKLNLSNLQSLITKYLFQYIINMTDTLIIKNCARYCYDI